ncbi:MAG: response regulator [Deltaproteobacteria bacterium]|nr:response regulator [Deltaproteobacteria bacterium]MCW5807702.1 response regulator [Deltaproteobacteria bacterium]
MAALIELESKRSHSVNGDITIGRGTDCHVRVDDPMVSMSHAQIVRGDDGAFRIRDLESRRGTYVGARKVKEATLKDGDELMIGPVRMRFEDDRVTTRRPGDSDELARLRAVVALGRAIGVEHDLGRLVDRVLDTCFDLLPADRGAVVVYEPGSKSPSLTVARDRSGGAGDFDISSSVLAQVMVSHQPLLRTEVDTDRELQRSQSLCAHGVRSVMAVPLRYSAGEDEWLGVIQLDTRASTHVFQPRDCDLLVAIAETAALAIKNAMLVRRVQAVIGEESRRMERLVGDLPLGIIVLDERGACTMANRWIGERAAAVWPSAAAPRPGAPVESVCGVPCERLVGANLRTHATGPDARTYSIAARTGAGVPETVIVVVDITEDRERQNQAAHRDRVALIGQLAGGVAHDFNNLLHVILTCASMVEEAVTEPTAVDDVRQIVHAATSAAELTRQLLTFSRRELVKPTVVDVSLAVHRMEKMLARTMGSQAELVVTVGPALPRILIDGAQLEQILMNLVVNARDAIDCGAGGTGRVTLSVSAVEIDPERANDRAIAPGRYVAIEVGDTGCGMPPETLARVFEPYFTTKARGKGTGLGLATVHGIVQQARGDIDVTSAIGGGTTFRIFLPATDQTGEEARTAGGGHAGGGTILVVDDDDSVRRVTERTLRNAGYTVLSASSGKDALALAAAHRGALDLVLTDIVMPGMSGRDLARELEQVRPTRVLFMSGYHQNTPIGGSQFLAKPFTRAALLEKVREALEASAAVAATSR